MWLGNHPRGGAGREFFKQSMMYLFRSFRQNAVVITTVLALLTTGLLGPVLHRHEGCCALPAEAEQLSADRNSSSGTRELCKCDRHAHCLEDSSQKNSGGAQKTSGSKPSVPLEHDESCSICIVLGQFGLTLTSLDFRVLSELCVRIELTNESDQFAILPDLAARGPPAA